MSGILTAIKRVFGRGTSSDGAPASAPTPTTPAPVAPASSSSEAPPAPAETNSIPRAEPVQVPEAAPPPLASEEAVDVVDSTADTVGDSQAASDESPQNTAAAPAEGEPVVAEETIVVIEEAVPLNSDAEGPQAEPDLAASDVADTLDDAQGEFVSVTETVIVVEDATSAADASELPDGADGESAPPAEEATASDTDALVIEDGHEPPQEA